MKTLLMTFAMLAVCGTASQASWAQKPVSKTSKLVGTWRLVSASQQMTDGTTRPDPQPGPHGKGYIIYSDAGIMCALLANPDRPNWNSIPMPTNAELSSAMGGLVAYCGTYEVNERDGYVVHHIEVDRVPNLAGTDRKRFFTLSGNRLFLHPAPPLPDNVNVWTVEFERVKRK